MTLVSWMLAVGLAANAPVAVPEKSLQEGQREWRAFHAAVVRDGTPRDFALASRLPWLDDGDAGPHEREAGLRLREAARGAPGDELVQWLWAASPAQASGCDDADPCPDRAMAFARLVPDNAIAWSPVLDEALSRHDQAGISAALERMAQSPYYDDRFALTVDAWRDLLVRHPWPGAARTPQGKPAITAAEREMALSVAATAMAARQSISTVGTFTYCNSQATPAIPAKDIANCQRIARLMLVSPTISQRSFGNGILRRTGSGADPDFQRQTQWWMAVMMPAENDPAELNRYFADLHSTQSEIRAIEFALQRAGKPMTPPAGWVFQMPPRLGAIAD